MTCRTCRLTQSLSRFWTGFEFENFLSYEDTKSHVECLYSPEKAKEYLAAYSIMFPDRVPTLSSIPPPTEQVSPNEYGPIPATPSPISASPPVLTSGSNSTLSSRLSTPEFSNYPFHADVQPPSYPPNHQLQYTHDAPHPAYSRDIPTMGYHLQGQSFPVQSNGRVVASLHTEATTMYSQPSGGEWQDTGFSVPQRQMYRQAVPGPSVSVRSRRAMQNYSNHNASHSAYSRDIPPMGHHLQAPSHPAEFNGNVTALSHARDTMMDSQPPGGGWQDGGFSAPQRHMYRRQVVPHPSAMVSSHNAMQGYPTRTHPHPTTFINTGYDMAPPTRQAQVPAHPQMAVPGPSTVNPFPTINTRPTLIQPTASSSSTASSQNHVATIGTPPTAPTTPNDTAAQSELICEWPDCNQTVSRSQAKTHARAHARAYLEREAGEYVTCPWRGCGAQLQRKSLERHLYSSKHLKGVFTCSKCFKDFTKEYNLSRHNQTLHEGKTRTDAAPDRTIQKLGGGSVLQKKVSRAKTKKTQRAPGQHPFKDKDGL